MFSNCIFDKVHWQNLYRRVQTYDRINQSQVILWQLQGGRQRRLACSVVRHVGRRRVDAFVKPHVLFCIKRPAEYARQGERTLFGRVSKVKINHQNHSESNELNFYQRETSGSWYLCMQCCLRFFNNIITPSALEWLIPVTCIPYSQAKCHGTIICVSPCSSTSMTFFLVSYTDEGQGAVEDCQRSMVPTSSTSHYAGRGDSCTAIRRELQHFCQLGFVLVESASTGIRNGAASQRSQWSQVFE